MKPKQFLRRAALITWLGSLGFAKKCVEKWLREGILPVHDFPGVPKKKGQRAYWARATVERILDLSPSIAGGDVQGAPPASQPPSVAQALYDRATANAQRSKHP